MSKDIDSFNTNSTDRGWRIFPYDDDYEYCELEDDEGENDDWIDGDYVQRFDWLTPTFLIISVVLTVIVTLVVSHILSKVS